MNLSPYAGGLPHREVVEVSGGSDDPALALAQVREMRLKYEGDDRGALGRSARA